VSIVYHGSARDRITEKKISLSIPEIGLIDAYRHKRSTSETFSVRVLEASRYVRQLTNLDGKLENTSQAGTEYLPGLDIALRAGGPS